NPSGGAKAKAEFAHDARYKLYTDGKFFDAERDDTEKSPLADDALGAEAKSAKAKLLAALKQFDGPRPEAFVKQFQPFGGETGENSEGEKKGKAKGKGKKK